MKRSTRRIYIALDSDGAGQAATRDLMTEFGAKAIALRYPTGCKDFTDCLHAGIDARTWFAVQTSPYIFADGAPASWASAMLTYMRHGAALLFVAMQQAARSGAIDPTGLTLPTLFQWAYENGFPVAQATFYRYFEACEGELFSECDVLPLNLLGYKSVSQTEKNPGGRPAKAYCMAERSLIQGIIRCQSWSRLYDQTFKTDGKKGKKAHPRIAGLIRLGIPNAATVAARLDQVYAPIYRRQFWACRYAEIPSFLAHSFWSPSRDNTPLLGVPEFPPHYT